MRKYIILLSLILILHGELFSQKNSKIEQFSSQTGSIIKFEDISLEPISLLYSKAETKIRKITNGNQTGYFFKITHEGKYGEKTASIAYEDLLELIRALQVLKSDLPTDLSFNPEYLENRFVTDDHLELGYYCSKGKSQWYIALSKTGSGNTIFPKNISAIESAFELAKSRIESLK